jgi:hypothetical protein
VPASATRVAKLSAVWTTRLLSMSNGTTSKVALDAILDLERPGGEARPRR